MFLGFIQCNLIRLFDPACAQYWDSSDEPCFAGDGEAAFMSQINMSVSLPDLYFFLLLPFLFISCFADVSLQDGLKLYRILKWHIFFYLFIRVTETCSLIIKLMIRH